MAELPPYYRESYFTSSTSLTLNSRDSVKATSLYTTTSRSASCAAGLRELTGRGLNAFGRMALSSVQSIIVRRRLQVIGSNIPLDDNARIEGLEDMYRDLLELCRFRLDSASVRTCALQMVLRQVANQHTAHLTKSLLEWPSEEAVLFISELLMCMDPTWTGLHYSRMAIHEDVQSIYSSSLLGLPDGEYEATPFIKFIAEVASTVTGARIVVDANILDVILFLYISAFVPRVPAYKSSSIFLACNDVLCRLAIHPEGFQNLCTHPVYLLWPRRASIPLTEAVRRQVKDRRMVWRSLRLANPSMVTRRIMRIDQILSLSVSDIPSIRRDFPSNEMTNTTSDIFDDFVDIIEFLRSDIYGDEVAQQARHLLALNIGCLGTVDDLPSSYDDMLDYIEYQVVSEKLKCRKFFDAFLYLLDIGIDKKYIPLSEHIVEIVRKTTESKNVSRSTYLAAILAVTLRMTKETNGPDDCLPDKDRGPHLLFDPSITFPSSAFPFCSSPVSYGPWRHNLHQTNSRHPAISAPYMARHLTPKDLLQFMRERSDQKSSPKAGSANLKGYQERDGDVWMDALAKGDRQESSQSTLVAG